MSMTMSREERAELETLDFRLRVMLPEEYQDTYESMQPVSMRSAGLKYGMDGRVAWNEIWGSFCDLAMAGGPPHKGTLLEPATPAAIEAQTDRYEQVVEEICRGVTMVTDLDAQASPVPGWIRVDCLLKGMAAWLLRAIVMENVAVRRDGTLLDLPAAPHFRLEKEVKNVVTVIAKTCHYWNDHMPRAQQHAIGDLLAEMEAEQPLVEPLVEPASAVADSESPAERQARLATDVAGRMAENILRETGLHAVAGRYAGWLGVECVNVRTAVWMMRAMVVCNVLARREGTVLFVPVNPARDPDGRIVTRTLARLHRLAAVREGID